MDSLCTLRPDWQGHLLLIHQTEPERRAGVATWVRRGLELGEKVLYIERPDGAGSAIPGDRPG